MFSETWMLEQHINIHVEKFKCEECSQHFHSKWRLMKHTEGYTNTKTRFCHYFNNAEKCPFQELVCMFKHKMSPECKFKTICNNQRCQFRHKNLNLNFKTTRTGISNVRNVKFAFTTNSNGMNTRSVIIFEHILLFSL